ncbi:MAG: selenocysteine-specific translation elongation factor [Anaerolineales bacterium]|nr:selenocysteine-specific translation elongation factor [Anaerolineales bacterium]
MRVIGTAGHVDHGKSTLIESLTGIHPDRLKEEREREMTIDLGFAWMELPGGEPVGIVDVPGHRDFIENMLAGISGIDAALFVVAADEGVMPQTREHLAILDILQINGGVIALTKIDVVPDQEWLDLVEQDVREVVNGTVLQDAPIMRVSAKNGQGIPEMLENLEQVLGENPPRQDLGRPRLPVDRVFSIAGFGTVVTGTMSDGHFRVSDEVEILPGGVQGRIRGLQTHKQKEDLALPGSRTAVNVSGVTLDEIKRGDVITHPGDYQPTRRMDVNFRLLPEVSQALKHNTEVKLYIGAAEVLARVRTLGKDVIQPGEAGWLQLEMREPVVAIRGDHYILRRPSPGETMGGGRVVDPNPKGRHKRFAIDLIERLESLSKGAPEDIYLQSLAALQAAPLREVTQQSNLEADSAQIALEQLVDQGKIVILEPRVKDLLVSSDILATTNGYYDQISSTALGVIQEYHTIYPLRRGMPKEELKSRLKISTRLFSSLVRKLVRDGSLREEGPLILQPDHEISFNTQQEKNVEHLLRQFSASPYSPPSIKDSKSAVGADIYQAMVDLGFLIPVSSDVVFRKEDYDQMVAEVQALLTKKGTLSAAQVRDHFNTSRRYVLALLEHLDEIGVTIRQGDVRRLK